MSSSGKIFGGGEWFPGLGEEEEGFGLGGSCCLLFFVMGWDCHGGVGEGAKGRTENPVFAFCFRNFSRLFWVGFPLGVSDRRQVQTDSSDQISTGSVTD